MKPANEEPKPRRNNLETVERILESMEEKIKGDQKATVADFIRLLQLRQELDVDEQPREITVKWVEPEEEDTVESNKEPVSNL